MHWLRILLWTIKGFLLLLCLSLVVLWVRSYWWRDELTHLEEFQAGGEYGIRDEWARSESGWVHVIRSEVRLPTDEVRRDWWNRFKELGLDRGWNRKASKAQPTRWELYTRDKTWGPVRWDSVTRRGSTSHGVSRHLRTRHWFPALVAGIWPLASLALTTHRALRRRRWSRRGRCRQCGYDLRATPDGASGLLPRCPECGRERVSSPPNPGD